jgi:hypothetical protein
VEALLRQGAVLNVDIGKLVNARRALNPFLLEQRRTVPAGGSIACAVCEFYRDDVCCGRVDAPR